MITNTHVYLRCYDFKIRIDFEMNGAISNDNKAAPNREFSNANPCNTYCCFRMKGVHIFSMHFFHDSVNYLQKQIL